MTDELDEILAGRKAEAKAKLLKWRDDENRRLILLALACKDEGWGTEREYLEYRLNELAQTTK